MKIKSALMLFFLGLGLSLPFYPAQAENQPIQDDTVTLSLSTESWVTTKTAKVTIGVEAAVSNANSGAMRQSMAKSIDEAIKADWRLTSFNRSQDSTGMERWSALYEARVPEHDLNGLQEKLKKSSKAGMQLLVADIQFTPTLEETQAVQTQLRATIYKMANEQLAALNAAIPNRSYRIGHIRFMDGSSLSMPQARHMRTMAKASQEMAASSDYAMGGANDEPMEKAQRLVLSALVELASVPPAK